MKKYCQQRCQKGLTDYEFESQTDDFTRNICGVCIKDHKNPEKLVRAVLGKRGE